VRFDRVEASLERLRQAPPAAVLVAGLGVFLALSLWGLRDESATYDEAAHLSAAYVPLRLGDYRLLTEQPPLGRRIAALPLLFMDVRLPLDHLSWERARYFDFGFVFLYQSENASDDLLFAARLAMLFWGLLLVGSVYAAAREAFGAAGGLLAMTACVFNPLLLGHARLVTTDVPATALLFLAVIAFARSWEAPSWGKALALGILSGGAVAAKFSALILIPAFLLTAVVGLIREWPGSTPGSPERRRWARRAALLGTAALTAYVVVWGAYGFRYAASPDPSFDLRQAMHFRPFSGALLERFEAWRLFPEAFLYGLAELRNHASLGHPAFAAGVESTHGWWWYFPFAVLVKSPIAFLVLALVGVRAWTPSASAAAWRLPCGVAALLLGLALLHSTLNMGLRHALPLFPFAWLACGAAVAPAGPAPTARARAAPWLLGLVLVLETLAGAPHYLPYFNAGALAVAERQVILSDSNVDWGQDLRRLKEFMDRRGIREVKLSYTGTASPRQLGLRHQTLSRQALYAAFEPEWAPSEELRPGDLVAVSVTHLTRPPDARLLERLEGQEEIARVGRSIVVYRIGSRPAK
jgi:hypothetical protein